MKKNTDSLSRFLGSINPFLSKGPTLSSASSKCIVREQKYHGLTWIDIENPKRKEVFALLEQYPLDPIHLEATILKGQLDQVEKDDKSIFMLLHVPRYVGHEKRVMVSKVSLFLGKDFVISIHRDTTPSLLHAFLEVQGDEKLQDGLFKKPAGHLLTHILGVVVQDISALHTLIMQEVDEIEDLVFDVNESGVYQISELRQKIVRQRRAMSSFRNVLQELAASQSSLVDGMARSFKMHTNAVSRMAETLEEARETVEIYKDADFTMSTERTNKILGILTIIFTLGMPATIIGAFYGMNVLIPGGIEAGPWTVLGPFTTFYFVVALAVTPAILMLWFFRMKKWF